jgi:hypothetical protein
VNHDAVGMRHDDGARQTATEIATEQDAPTAREYGHLVPVKKKQQPGGNRVSRAVQHARHAEKLMIVPAVTSFFPA